MPLAWALSVAQSLEKPNVVAPVIVKGIFRGRRRRLNWDDMVELHQLGGIVKIMVKKGEWSVKLEEMFNNVLLSETRNVYKKWDKCRETEVRDEILKLLADKGIRPEEDDWVGNTWRADIRFSHLTILLTGKWRLNDQGAVKGREYAKEVGLKMNVRDVLLVDADEWKTLEEKGKSEKIEDIARKVVKSSVPRV